VVCDHPGVIVRSLDIVGTGLHERSLSAGLNTSQINRHPRHSSRHASQSCIVDLVRGIRRAVVMFVSEQGRIRHHTNGGRPKKAKMVRIAKTEADRMSGLF